MVTDVSERKRMEERLRYLADRDSLTGLNRRRLIEKLEQSLADAARYHHFGAILMIDLDNFKIVNDTRGHAAGDAMLKSVADVLSARTRETDLAARLGGDEFAVLLQHASEEQARTVARDICCVTLARCCAGSTRWPRRRAHRTIRAARSLSRCGPLPSTWCRSWPIASKPNGAPPSRQRAASATGPKVVS